MFGRWPRFWKGKSDQLPRYVLCIYFIGRGHRPVLLGHKAKTLSQATKETGAFDCKWCLILKFFSEERFSLQKLGAVSNLSVFKTKGIMPWVVQKVCAAPSPNHSQNNTSRSQIHDSELKHHRIWPEICFFNPCFVLPSMSTAPFGPISTTRYFRGVMVSKETLQQQSNARVRNAATLDHGEKTPTMPVTKIQGASKGTAKAKSLLSFRDAWNASTEFGEGYMD